MPELGKTLLIIGLTIAAAGLILLLAGRLPWIGRLPGDIFIKREQFTFYSPLTTSLLLSAIISLLLWIFRK